MVTRIDFVSLIKDHQSGVWRYLRVLGCDATQADDLTQETFLAVLERPFEDHGPLAAAAYLRKVARNQFVSYLRRANRSVSLEQVDEIERDWTRWAGHDAGESYLSALEDCLSGLGDRARRALNLKYREDKSRNEIAQDLEMSEDGAKNLLQRAKQSLRECVERKFEKK
jgi:RNA polymerase sigma-70 factor (ECF subfamily)